jgi:hypothetical protein
LSDGNSLGAGVALEKGAPVVDGESFFCSHFA